MAELPAWATEPVEIVDADPDWSRQAQRLADQVADRLSPWLRSSVEHVGSTAVPGLAAKPILDLQALICGWETIPPIAEALTRDGWFRVSPELDQRSWRRFFVAVRAGRRHAHLHLMQPGAVRWQQQRDFRDALRADPVLAERYAALKRGLAATGTDREQYSAAKTDFVRSVVS